METTKKNDNEYEDEVTFRMNGDLARDLLSAIDKSRSIRYKLNDREQSAVQIVEDALKQVMDINTKEEENG